MINFNMVQRYLSQGPAAEAAELPQLRGPTGTEGYWNTSKVGVGKHAS